MKANLLKAKMVENGISADMISNKLGINTSTFYRKVKNNSFYTAETKKIAECLKLSAQDIDNIFFS